MKAWRRGVGLRGIRHGRVQERQHELDKECALEDRREVRAKLTGDDQLDRQRIVDRIERVDERLAQLDSQAGGADMYQPEPELQPGRPQVGEDWLERVQAARVAPSTPSAPTTPAEPPGLADTVLDAASPGVGTVAAGLAVGIAASFLGDMISGVSEACSTPITSNPEEIVSGEKFVDNVKAPTLTPEAPQAPAEAPQKEEEAQEAPAPKAQEQRGIQWFSKFEGGWEAPAPTPPAALAMPGITGP